MSNVWTKDQMIISIILILGVTNGDLSGWTLLMLGITWIPDVAIAGLLLD